ncbi:ABC transporter substrate-binding protein [Rubrivivax gelatinosus]|uniref:Sorbitol-binding protein /mannitol-binding protein n=1 Tax=Rubrivivax gelatinosus TaxID=28068 RepID=A0A4R2M3E8_RUBGE|nr:sugar ABC transporter substrate-binding protein [Rubrivivax gelatinosus]MBK1688010.1 sugar ABC transporter substrate-binding protein [Rubrivivax gelatinosus]TCO99294.1 sorbitol-binding protein /mannitol-binding protein [Rubrivivax gelatinosus]
MRRLLQGLVCWLAALAAPASAVTEIVVATVNNEHMIEMQRLTPHFERANPEIRVRWVTLEETALRQRVSTDIARGSSRYDVLTIGMYETQLWAPRGWLRPIDPPADYEIEDLLPAIRAGLTHQGRLYAAPFYGESSMLYYRRDLAERAGIALPERPTWRQVRDAAERLHDPAAGVYGICLRGKPGWGENLALVMTMANAFGGQWADMNWRPQLDSKPWRDAVSLYVEMLRRFGPPGSAANGYNELLTLFRAGRCALWVDATIAAGFLSDPATSRVAGRVGFAQAPRAVTAKGANWLWTWSLAVPTTGSHPQQARRFVSWATSRAYIELVARERGWGAVPTGTRRSTYENPEFQRVAGGFAAAERKAIDSADPDDPTLPRSPYRGIQYAAIPEFQAIGTAVGQQIAAALTGRSTVEQALQASQAAAEREMRAAGLLK